MKKIEYSVEYFDYYVEVIIEEQTHRCGDFGINPGERHFLCKNGICLRSHSSFCSDFYFNTIYMRGSSLSSDFKPVLFNIYQFNKFKECIEEYNDFFRDKE